MFIPDPGSGFSPFLIPDLGVKKQNKKGNISKMGYFEPKRGPKELLRNKRIYSSMIETKACQAKLEFVAHLSKIDIKLLQILSW